MKCTALLSLTSLVVALGLMAACSGKGASSDQTALTQGEFVIEGQLPAGRYDSACLYLVPMQGPHPRPVDSVFVGHDGRFRFQGNVEQMAVLRLSMRQRIGVQDLLVVTEPGITHVVLDSISSSYGTPQNDSLQAWKDRLQLYQQRHRALYQQQHDHILDSAQYRLQLDQLQQQMGQSNYSMLKGMGRQTLSMFIFNQMFNGKLDSLRRAELQALLRDTTDYTLPQPGFRR